MFKAGLSLLSGLSPYITEAVGILSMAFFIPQTPNIMSIAYPLYLQGPDGVEFLKVCSADLSLSVCTARGFYNISVITDPEQTARIVESNKYLPLLAFKFELAYMEAQWQISSAFTYKPRPLPGIQA